MLKGRRVLQHAAMIVRLLVDSGYLGSQENGFNSPGHFSEWSGSGTGTQLYLNFGAGE